MAGMKKRTCLSAWKLVGWSNVSTVPDCGWLRDEPGSHTSHCAKWSVFETHLRFAIQPVSHSLELHHGRMIEDASWKIKLPMMILNNVCISATIAKCCKHLKNEDHKRQGKMIFSSCQCKKKLHAVPGFGYYISKMGPWARPRTCLCLSR